MTTRRTWGVAVGATVGALAGLALFELFSPHTTTYAVMVVGAFATAYALLAVIVTTPVRADVPLGPTTGFVAARTVLPGLGVAAPVVTVPQPRSVAEAAA